MATFLPLGTGFYEATNPRLPNDVNITTLISGAISDAIAAIPASVAVADDFADDAAAATGGIGIGELYHTSGAVKIRVA